MKLTPILVLAIFFFAVSIGMPNPLESTIVENRGKQYQQSHNFIREYLYYPTTTWKMLLHINYLQHATWQLAPCVMGLRSKVTSVVVNGHIVYGRMIRDGLFAKRKKEVGLDEMINLGN